MGKYRIYDGPPIYPRPIMPSSPLGAIPDDNLDTLPPGSRLTGESSNAKGVVVKESLTIGNFFFSAATIVVAMIIVNIIGKKFDIY